MRRVLLASSMAGIIVACGLEIGGPSSEIVDGGDDVIVSMMDASADTTMWPDNFIMDVTYDIPDLGTGETEAGIPCTCVPPVPSGWTLVSYNQKMQTACPEYYMGPSVNYVENPVAIGPTQCACMCNGFSTAPSCTGNVTFTIETDKGMSCSDATHTVMCNSTCTTGMWTWTATGNKLNYMKTSAAAPSASGGVCAAPTATKNVPGYTVDQGRACELSAPLGLCAMNNICAPVLAQGEQLCIRHNQLGHVSCPAEYPKPHKVGTSVIDTRGCGPSNCTSCTAKQGSCSQPKLNLYTDNQCMMLGTSEDANGMCTNVGLGNAATFLSARYDSTNSGASCSAPAYSPIGSLDVSNAQTICCR